MGTPGPRSRAEVWGWVQGATQCSDGDFELPCCSGVGGGREFGYGCAILAGVLKRAGSEYTVSGNRRRLVDEATCSEVVYGLDSSGYAGKSVY